MELSPQSSKVLCQVRREWVHETPEERVRQKLLGHLINDLHFPPAMLVVEKELSQLTQGRAPQRRLDLIAYYKEETELLPLLLIECKAIKLTQSVVLQAAGYNSYLAAPYIAIANEEEVRMGWYDTAAGKYRFIPYIPIYDQLRRSIQPETLYHQ